MDENRFLEQIKKSEMHVKKYEKGEVIMSHWKGNYSSIFIEEGTLRMTNNNLHGTMFNLYFIKGKQLLLFNSILNNLVMSTFDLEVVSDQAKLYFITPINLSTFVNQSCDSFCYVINCLQKQVTFLWAKLCDFTTNGKIGAVCGQLLAWVYLFGVKKSEKYITIDLEITLQDVGNACGIAHVSSVSRILSDLKRKKVLNIKKRELQILDLEELKLYAPKIEEWMAINARETWQKMNI